MSIEAPNLAGDYPLNAETIARYRQDGHLRLSAVCSPSEVLAFRAAITRVTAACSTEARPLEERDTYGRAFLQVTNLWVRDEVVRRYVLARRFAKIAADLLGVDGVRLYHDQALYKEAGGGLTPWHQDQYYWPLDTDKTVTMWMPLVDVSVEMGALTFASGSHREGFLGHVGISDESQEKWESLVRERGYPVHRDPMCAGDATFHSGWTLHCAPGNSSTSTREVMTVIYFADGTRIMDEPDNENRWIDLRAWLPGVKPGQPAEGELTPVLYRSQDPSL